MQETEAKIGNWYQAPDGQTFEVVAIDADGGIGIQHIEGEVAELDPEVWEQMLLVEIEAPKDWAGAYDDMDRDDLGYSDEVIHPENWSDQLLSLDAED